MSGKKTNLNPVQIVHTPADWEELNDWIERHSPDERAHLMVAAIMAWNLACKLAAEAQTDEVSN